MKFHAWSAEFCDVAETSLRLHPPEMAKSAVFFEFQKSYGWKWCCYTCIAVRQWGNNDYSLYIYITLYKHWGTNDCSLIAITHMRTMVLEYLPTWLGDFVRGLWFHQRHAANISQRILSNRPMLSLEPCTPPFDRAQSAEFAPWFPKIGPSLKYPRKIHKVVGLLSKTIIK